MGGARGGKRAGPRRKATVRPALLGLALGITAAIVAWGYLVYAAIDFGATARDGDSQAWWFLALASVGAVACLFVGLMLVARLLRALGISSPRTPRDHDDHDDHDQGDEPGPPAPGDSEPPRPIGGRRAAR